MKMVFQCGVFRAEGDESQTKTPSWICSRGFRFALISPSNFGACKELSVGVRALSPKPLDEVELDAGQWTADVVQGIAIGKWPEIDRD
jgi:hypothetical protein